MYVTRYGVTVTYNLAIDISIFQVTLSQGRVMPSIQAPTTSNAPTGMLDWMINANKIGDPQTTVMTAEHRKRQPFKVEGHHAAILEAARTRIVCNQEMPSLMPEGVHYAPTMLQALLTAKAIVRIEAKRMKKLHYTTYRITDIGCLLLDDYRAQVSLAIASPLN